MKKELENISDEQFLSELELIRLSSLQEDIEAIIEDGMHIDEGVEEE